MSSVKHSNHKYFSVSNYKPIVTYAGDTKLFFNLEAMLTQALPQERAEWRRSYGRGLREVSLNAVFKPFSVDILQKEENFHLLEQPILHIFWTQCPDVDTYKTVCYEEIKHWLQTLQTSGVVDWLIVLVEIDESRKYNKLLPRTTVLDKIKSDFGVKHIDRCLSLNNFLKAEFRAGSSWRALLVNIRLLMLTAYDRALLKFEDYIRKQRESRNEPNWSFCDYFLLQEELAFALEMLGIHEEALIQYDELEALFTQFIKNSSLTSPPKWVSCFQVPADGWSSITLMNEVNQHYREAIRNHNIPLLDFRCYLFLRQAAMLLLLSKPWEIAQRTLPFIHNSLNEIRILEITYPKGAISCWIIVCCLEVIFLSQNVKESAQSDACSLYTAPLMELAILHLHKLGDLCGLMPNDEQTSEQLHIVVGLSAGIGDPPHAHKTITASPVDKLKESLSSKDAYCRMYLELCEQAVCTYKHRKRMRSARYIEKQWADFYMRMGKISKAAQLLVNPLSSYEVDNWPLLTNQIRLQLLECYKQTNEVEKLLRTSISVASSDQFDLQVQMSSFNDVMRIIQETNDIAWIVLLEHGFFVENITVEVQQTGLRVRATIELINKFPTDISCSNISISIHPSSNNNNDIKDKSSVKTDNSSNAIVKHVENANTADIPPALPLVYILDYQQDKSLAGARIICKSQETFLKRKSSQKLIKPLLPNKQDYSNALSCNSVVLKPGSNSVNLESKKEAVAGQYHLGQICINISDKLLFLSLENYYADTKYNINHVPPRISVEIAENKTLIAGIPSTVNLNIDLGTYLLSEDATLILHASKGLKIGSPNEETLDSEIELKLSCNHVLEGNIFHVPLVLCSEFSSQTEAIIDHKVSLRCPWSGIETSLIVQFFVPFIVLRQIHTIKSRKFLQLTITGSTKETVILKDPELSTDVSDKLTIKSLNPSSSQPFAVSNNLKVKFMWELVLENDFPDRSTLKFTLNYSLYDETSIYKYEFDVSNFATLYTIESRVDPSRGCEYCRVNTMCHFSFTVRKIAPTVDHSLKYEVITDQTMWAVCNVSSGVIILDDTDKCSILVDLMPLCSGYLPLPIIKLSKYFPIESNLGNQKMSPRFEPFSQGQVFNANKATQVQVLPSVSATEL